MLVLATAEKRVKLAARKNSPHFRDLFELPRVSGWVFSVPGDKAGKRFA
jgi:hypothetical protein